MNLKRKRNGSQHLEQRLAALQSDLARLQADFRGLAVAGGEIAGDGVAGAFASAEDAADRAVAHLGTWADDNLVSVRDQVRAQPLASVLISMGAGALVGALFLRR